MLSLSFLAGYLFPCFSMTGNLLPEEYLFFLPRLGQYAKYLHLLNNYLFKYYKREHNAIM